MRAEECIDGLERDFEASEAEGRVRARVEANVHQLVVIERDVRVFADAPGDLRVPRRGGIAVPVSAHTDAGTIDRPQIDRTLRVAGELHLDRAEAADDDVLQHLLAERTEAVIVIGHVKIVSKNLRAQFAAGNLLQLAAVLGLDAPLHARDAVLDSVDGLAGDRGFSELAQVGGRRFRHCVRARAVSERSGQGKRAAFFLMRRVQARNKKRRQAAQGIF